MGNWQIFENTFRLFCFFTTTAIVIFWIYKFCLNEDLSVVEYKQYDMKNANDVSKSPYPSQTMCFKNPFITSKQTHLNASEKHRVDGYLRGWEHTDVSNIDYNNLALNITDYVKQYYICLLYTSPSPRDLSTSRMPSSA